MRLLFHDRGSYHIETNPLIWRANQCTGFYMIGTAVMKWVNELKHAQFILFLLVTAYRSSVLEKLKRVFRSLPNI